MAEEQSRLFRQEALEHHRARRLEGTVLRIAPRWTKYSYWIVVWTVLAALVFIVFATIHEYATAPAVVRIEGRTALTARVEGTILEVPAKPGEHVREGDVLVRFDLRQEEAELERIAEEHAGLVLRTLRDPSDQAARAALNSLQAERELAEARLAQRSVTAPQDGIITDVRVHPGQAVALGDGLVTLTKNEAVGRVLAMVPAHYRPMLHAGIPLRLELAGFRFAYQDLHVDEVGDEAVGPAEVKRYLGPDNGDTIVVQGPSVLVQASLPHLLFTSEGQAFRYYDGMIGTADVRVRTEPILVAMIPGLRDVWRSFR